MPEHDASRIGSSDTSGIDIGLNLCLNSGIACYSEILGNEHHHDGHGRREDANEGTGATLRDHDGDHDGQQEGRESIQSVHDEDKDAVKPPGHIAGHDTQRHTNEDGQNGSQEYDLDGGTRAKDNARQYIESADSRAQDVLCGHGLLWCENLGETVGSQERCTESD